MRTASTYLLALLAALQGVSTCIIDSGRAHAMNRGWPGHARFHVVWQFSTTLLLAGCSEWLLFETGAVSGGGFRLAAMLTSLPMLGFLVAVGTRRRFGASTDDGSTGSRVTVHVAGRVTRIDLNLALVLMGLAALLILCWMHGSGHLQGAAPTAHRAPTRRA